MLSIVNYCVNIVVLKLLGVIDVFSISVCGLFCENMVLGDFVIVDQFIDWIFVCEKLFFGFGFVVYVSVVYLICEWLMDVVEVVVKVIGVIVYCGGIYFVMEGL